MKRTIWSVVMFAVVCLAVVPVAEAERFSVRDVNGPTAFAFDGFVTVGAVMVPAAAVGRFTADGNGNITDGVRTLVVGGTTVPATFTCTYTVNSDGTGVATCTVTTAGVDTTETFDFVIVEKGKEAFFTSTTAGSTLRGETKRQ
jgi:hypothetical protein